MDVWIFELTVILLYQLVLRLCLWKARWKVWDRDSFGYRLAETQLTFPIF